MFKIASALLALVLTLCGGPARSQSACPYIAADAVLTPAQWQACFTAKQDAASGGGTGVTATPPIVATPSGGNTIISINNGTSVANPGTGTLEALLPIQSVTGGTKAFGQADLFMETRRSNSGSGMTDTFPASTTTGLTNGTKITVTNADPSAQDVITAGSGTQFSNGASTFTVGQQHAVQFAYDTSTSPATWRATLNTGNSARVLLTAAKTLYYRTDGNNTACNGGTNASSSGAPNCAFADPGFCMTYAANNIDRGGNAVTCLAGETTPKTFAAPAGNGFTCPVGGFTGAGTFTLAGNLSQATVTTPVASPGVVNWTGHGLTAGSPVYFTVTGGSLPGGLSQTQLFYVIAAGLGTNSFEVSTSVGGGAVNFTGSSTGTQTGNAPTTLIDGTANGGTAISIANGGCVMTVSNLQIKATANSLSCISHEGESGFDWGNIVWLGSGAIDVFVGTGCNVFQVGTDWIAAQGGSLPHVEADGIGEFRNSGQATNISANLTYGTTTGSFVWATLKGKITYTKNPTVNLNGFSVTGQRCYADNQGLIEQSGLGGSFFPGNSVCTAGIGGMVIQ